MPSLQDTPVVPLPVNGVVNGTNGQQRPQTPTTNMALTEYTINPSTKEKRARIKKIVPEEYLLPTGYPDVSNTKNVCLHISDVANRCVLCLTVPPPHRQRHLPSLRGLQGHPVDARHQPQQPTRVQRAAQA